MSMNYKAPGTFRYDRETGSSFAIPPCDIKVVSEGERVLQSVYNLDGLPTASSSAILNSAKNEVVAFQIIVANQGKNIPLSDISFVIGSWTESLEDVSITMYKEHYIPIDSFTYMLDKQYSTGEEWLGYDMPDSVGMYPDALVPFVDPYTEADITSATYLADDQSIAPLKSQGYWVDISVPSDAVAGTYSCSISVKSGEQVIGSIPISLTIKNITMPAVWSFNSWVDYIGSSFSYKLGDFHNVTRGTEEFTDLCIKYEQFLYQHGISTSPRMTGTLEYVGGSYTGHVSFSAADTTEMLRFVDAYNPKYIFVRSYPVIYSNTEKLTNYLTDYKNYTDTLISTYAEDHPNLNDVKWFFYIDEPDTAEEIALVKTVASTISSVWPDCELLITINSSTFLVDSEAVAAIDTACVLAGYAKQTTMDITLADKTKWFYFALVHDGLDWHIDSNLMDYRIPFWSSYNYGINGVLYWSVMHWAATSPYFTEPWTDPRSFSITDYWAPYGDVYYNGEAVLVYPGTEAGIDGPVASMRLKQIRRGMYDYEYFKLAESQVDSGQTEIEELVDDVAPNFFLYSEAAAPEYILTGSKNPIEYESKKEEIAALI